MTAALCETLTERADSQAILQQLEQANLFIVPLDDERRWTRFARPDRRPSVYPIVCFDDRAV